jgi:hypothetical protein
VAFSAKSERHESAEVAVRREQLRRLLDFGGPTLLQQSEQVARAITGQVDVGSQQVQLPSPLPRLDPDSYLN